jgi:predicted cupin superfamily sugar epimerase
LIDLYQLAPHPEGGFFKETYRATEVMKQVSLPKRFPGNRTLSTAIVFLLPEGTKSHVHRSKSDEIWHFHLGGPLTLVQIAPTGKMDKIILGPDVRNGQMLQHAVPHGYWFGAVPNPGSLFSFVGCTVAPGFDFADFELGDRNKLLAQYPQAKEEIILLTRLP